MISADYLQKDRKSREDFDKFCNLEGGLGLRQNLRPDGGKPKTALIVSQYYLPFASLEALMMKAMQMAGFETVMMGNRRYDFLRYGWLAGNKKVIEPFDFNTKGDPEWVDQQIGRLDTLHDWLSLEYQGVHVGRFTIASTLRLLKVGQLDFTDRCVQAKLRASLESSVLHTLRTKEVLKEIKPDCILVMDRGYLGYGEVFDLAINSGIDAINWILGYKSNRLVVKRYHSGNEREHPLSLSAELWRLLCSIPWKPEYGNYVREELFQCYQRQDWFSVVGTQFDKQILSRQMTRETLGLSSDKKVAVIFPHILWDGSFFFGEDLFDDYTQWFIETIRAATANSRIQWVVKIHPAHLVKAKQANDQGKPAELNVIEGVIGNLPDHVKLVFPETGLSTFSLFEVADYAVTVRGTVGIEAALFGVPVITAGTGRYDRRGFTLDSNTRQEYLHKLETLENYPRLSKEQIEIAERYAYGVFFCRPLSLSSVSLDYARDGKATPKVSVHCQTRQQWLASPDMRQLADFIADGKAEDMLSMATRL
jgi:hypothetical protein